MNAYFGCLEKTFRFDYGCIRRPRLRGIVVASISFSSYPDSETATLQLYGVFSEAYPATASEEFETAVLPRLAEWVTRRLNRPDTAIKRYERLIVEWTGAEHVEHPLQYG
jgi:hypothetical protein